MIACRLFKNNEHNDIINNNGFLLVENFLSNELIEICKNYFNDTFPNVKLFDNYWAITHSEVSKRVKTNKFLQKIFLNSLQNLFVNYKCLSTGFLLKVANPKNSVTLHQDLTIMDESQFSFLSIWIPLIDVDETNGCMQFVAKTHKLYNGYRTPTSVSPFQLIENLLIMNHLTSVPCKAGDAVVFFPNILHYTGLNLTNEKRIVVDCFISEMNAFHTIAFHNNKNNNIIDLYKMNDDFLHTYNRFITNRNKTPMFFRKYKSVVQNEMVYTYEKFLEDYSKL